VESIDIVLIVIGFICMIVGLLGSFVPGLPGTPLSYVGVLLLHFTNAHCFSVQFLIIWAIATIIIQVLDFIVPAWGTKKFGGSRAGTIGCTIGVFVGLFCGPLGIILCPFAGAVIGELFANQPFNLAFKAGFGAFLGFLAGVFIKLAASIVLTFFFVKEVCKMLF